jgi:hypothetical protein
MLTDNLPHIDQVPPKLLKQWLGFLGLKFWSMLIIEVSAYFIVPFISVFYRWEIRTDSMKRVAHDKGLPRYTQFTVMRQYLPKWANWFQTHDNAADEYWYGMYDDFINNRFTQKQYDNSRLLQYYNRVMWHWRNKAYGYSYTVVGEPMGFDDPDVFEVGTEDSGELWVRIEKYPTWFKYEAQIPNGKGRYRSVNIGWKSHRSAPPLPSGVVNVLYGNRLAWLSRKSYKD